MNDVPLLVAVVVIGYLLGSVPSGQIVGWLAGGVDLSQHGSGKTGTTNALRTLGWGAAAAVFCGDLAKGIAAVVLAHVVFGGHAAQHWAEVLAGFAAVLGHNWSVFINLKGGRGVAVSMAIFYLICWPAALLSTAIALVVLLVSRFVSLASLIGAVVGLVLLTAFVVWGTTPVPYLVYGVLAAALIWLRHIDNIQRLLAGTERKLGQRA